MTVTRWWVEVLILTNDTSTSLSINTPEVRDKEYWNRYITKKGTVNNELMILLVKLSNDLVAVAWWFSKKFLCWHFVLDSNYVLTSWMDKNTLHISPCQTCCIYHCWQWRGQTELVSGWDYYLLYQMNNVRGNDNHTFRVWHWCDTPPMPCADHHHLITASTNII